MVNLAAMVWRRLLRKRWVLALVFGLSLVYFLTSTFKQEERAVRDRNLLQVQDHDQPILWKVQFNLGNSSRPSNQCRNSIQGKHLITDELGYVCERKDLLVNGCCNVNVPGTKQYCCDGCLTNGCCSAYEHCVSCCLQPNKQLLLERFLNRAAVAFQNLFMAVEDHFELCLAKCRTSSQGLDSVPGGAAEGFPGSWQRCRTSALQTPPRKQAGRWSPGSRPALLQGPSVRKVRHQQTATSRREAEESRNHDSRRELASSQRTFQNSAQASLESWEAEFQKENREA
ncbi:SREBP regulating gene protein isoform X3 [Myotis daubentonii]|uniref:SREBP regulating gene protein isoform X3 n=1 Tax=Myotis daubentonii TaxID=98922 RepID=UPI0028731E63|nr:SREBP regulating gene protein isoform X3 [Myotis daubentonii]